MRSNDDDSKKVFAADLPNTSFTLTAGSGDDDNDSFTLEGDELQLASPLDYESKNEYHPGQGNGHRWAQH